MKRHIWLIISWLRLRQVCWFSFRLLCKLLRHWAKRMSYFKWRFWYISFPMRLCHVRFLFLVIYCAVQTPYTLRSKKYIEKHARWNNFWLTLSSVHSSSFSLLRKLLRRWAREKSKMTTHNWHIDTWMRLCQAFVRFPVVYCSILLRHWATRRRNM